MPARQPFTQLCQRLAQPVSTGRADLHVHTTHSDGEYTPAQVVDLARRSGLAAVAITDHDTLCGVPPAQSAAGPGLEVIAGVEVTSEHEGHELHLLGYFVALDNVELDSALARLCERRRERFHGMVERLRGGGVSIDDEAFAGAQAIPAPSRRTLATMLHATGQVGSVREAFDRWLGDAKDCNLPKTRLPIGEAIALVRGAGGVTSLAHPANSLTLTELAAFREMGLQGIEVDYPTHRAGRIEKLRHWARELDIAVTGGSDCHGPGHTWRGIGTCGVSADELSALRARTC